MAENTKIEWCDHTQNFWIGCTKVSKACDRCYAEVSTPSRTMRVGWGPGVPRHRTAPSTWAMPKKWNDQHETFFAKHGRRQRVFALSLGDWLDNEVPIEWFVDMLEVVRTTPNLDWLLLTKRIGMWRNRLEAAAQALAQGNAEGVGHLRDWIAAWLDGKPPANVWAGATICNEPEADRDIPKLLAVPARVRFLSIEPLLGPIELGLQCENWSDDIVMDPETGARECCRACDFTGIGNDIDWVIVGGESGHGARPMHPDWARSLRDQCQAAGVPFLFKQWGEHDLSYDRDRDDPDYRRCDAVARQPGRWINLAGGHGFNGERVHYAHKVGKKAAGRLLDGRTWDEVPG